MNPLLRRLEGGDLRSDGAGDAVAGVVLRQPELFGELYEGVHEAGDVVRGRSAHSLELVARSRPDLLMPHLPELLQVVERDPVPMVRWHIAMILGHLAATRLAAGMVVDALLRLLKDRSAFVRSWSIASLTIYGSLLSNRRGPITREIAQLLDDPSVAVRRRAELSFAALQHGRSRLPAGWVKSAGVRKLLRL